MSKNITTQPGVNKEENISSSTIASTITPYYGSRTPKQSVIETDRVIFQMMDDIQITVQPELKKDEGSIHLYMIKCPHMNFWLKNRVP